MSALAIYVRLHDGRFHGRGDWPPSPARLFQALVAGAGLGGPLSPVDREALEWLEKLHKQKAPLIAAPLGWRPRRGVLVYMPNNDSDRIGGDPLQLARIRTATKVFQPYFFDPNVPFVYVWSLALGGDDIGPARRACALAERLYQFGRGIDMAWAWGEILDEPECDRLLSSYPGRVFRPSAGRNALTLPSPEPGSLESLERRHQAFGERFRYAVSGRSVSVVFRRPPPARFRPVDYDGAPRRQLYELRSPTTEAEFTPYPLDRVSALVVWLRDRTVERLTRSLPERRKDIERVLVGRRPDGTNDGPPQDRVRILPLPSIGHVHADGKIRRVLVEVPSTCSVRADDVYWAFSGLDVTDVETGEIEAVLVPTEDEKPLRHYGVQDGGYRTWHTVTPAALPEGVRRRRVDPSRKRAEAKAGVERAREQARAADAVCRALRHAEIRTAVKTIRVQREPFEGHGTRVDRFADGTRFAKERLWHVEVAFEAPVSGPLVIGDGRFLGLGIMAPVEIAGGVSALVIESGLLGTPDFEQLARALRRAVMARVQEICGVRPLPAFFSGHDPDGAPVCSAKSSHLAFTVDLARSRLLILAPHLLDGRLPTPAEIENLRILDEALDGFSELRAGVAGLLRLRAIQFDAENDPLFVVSRTWESLTPYRVTRHLAAGSATAAIKHDVKAELRRRGLPNAAVNVAGVRAISGRGLEGILGLDFATPVRGPLLLGRSRYLGGGLFLPRT